LAIVHRVSPKRNLQLIIRVSDDRKCRLARISSESESYACAEVAKAARREERGSAGVLT